MYTVLWDYMKWCKILKNCSTSTGYQAVWSRVHSLNLFKPIFCEIWWDFPLETFHGVYFPDHQCPIYDQILCSTDRNCSTTWSPLLMQSCRCFFNFSLPDPTPHNKATQWNGTVATAIFNQCSEPDKSVFMRWCHLQIRSTQMDTSTKASLLFS